MAKKPDIKTTKKKKPVKKKPVSNFDKHYLPGSRVKFSFSRHIFPPLMGLLVFVIVFGFFNSTWISGQIAYAISSRHADVSSEDKATEAYRINKDSPPKIIINKINVTAPLVFDQAATTETAFEKDLENGVVHYPNTAVPGQTGNVVVFGHSSGQWWAPGDYKFVFTLLNKVQIGDKIFIDYQGIRYEYNVYNLEVVHPDNLTVLNQSSSHMLTVITCTPVGSSTNRLIIQARQIVPAVSSGDDSTAAVTSPTGDNSKTVLPAADPSVWHSLTSLF